MSTGDSWSIGTGEDNGKPLIFRIRNGAPAFAQRKHFPHLLAVCWKYESPNDQGMPSQETAEQMRHLEDLLEPAFESAQKAFLSVIVTGNGVREWQWYARNPKEVMTLVNEILGELDPFPVQFSFEDDPEWQAYAQFLDMKSAQ